MNIERLPSEGCLEYANRITEAVKDGVMNWQEWSDALVGSGIYSGESCRKNGQFFKRFLEKCDDFNRKSLEKCEVITERKKLQDVTRELNEQLRAISRTELINERILDAIDRLPEINIDFDSRYLKKVEVGKKALLLFGDVHAGSVYEIRGLNGEIINRYDWDTMCKRMRQILSDMENAINSGMDYDEIVVCCCGDFVEGILRDDSLSRLREPVFDTVIKFSEFYSQWLVKLHEICRCDMRVLTIGGNHDIARLLTSKPQFNDESYAKIIREFIAIRLQDVDGIIIKPYAEFDIENICGVCVGFAHGTDKDLSTLMDYYSNLYEHKVDEIYAGHLHSNSQQTNGTFALGDRVCTRIGSICGIDKYSHKIRKNSKPSYYFAIYEDFYGKTWERKFYLD